MFADLGADVVRVERPGQERDFAAPVTLRGRRRLVVDIKDEAEVATLLDLLDRADVLIEPFRPGVAERLGIGPEVCLERNPRLIYARMTGWGQEGPWSKSAGHDINYIAVTGALYGIGRADGPPQPPINLLGDFGGGTMFLLLGVMAALWEREHSGLGQVVDAAIVDGTAALTSFIHGMRADGVWSDGRGVNILDTGSPYYDVYKTADGKWMAVGAIEPKFFAELVALLELTDLPDQNDRSRWPELRTAFTTRFLERTQAQWASLFDGTDACVAPVLDWNEAVVHPHLAARGTLVTVDGAVQPAPAPRFSRTPGAIPGKETEPEPDASDILRHWS
jgi:alpha-methylacyl-CoA racemase